VANALVWDAGAIDPNQVESLADEVGIERLKS
jgi:hypothetical protein